LQSADKEFTMQVHNLTQLDYRTYNHTANIPNGAPPNIPGASGPNDTFTFPRVWLIFNGNITQNWDWMLAPAFGFDNVNLLDAWVNAHYDDRFQIKAGRYKTPFTYEFYAEPIQGLINPERSLFFNNFGLNRQDGVMAHGTILDSYVDYAIGVYNGQRNGFLSNTNSKDIAGYFNVRPFMNSEWCALERIDVGASFDYGDENNPATAGSPTVLRTNVATNGNLVNGVEFLQFAPTVREKGQRALGSLHAAYYYQQLSLVAELQGGVENYVNTAPPAGGATSARVPIGSWYIQGGYFLTGETTTFRNTVKPLCPFTLNGGGIGAIELAGRFNYLNINDRIFTDKLVDTTGGNVWTNRVDLIDLGVNWYPNQWIKYSATWEHASFGSPVTYRPGLTQNSNDMFMLRTQLWF
jgi:phosphate-selective porin OprO/OprP